MHAYTDQFGWDASLLGLGAKAQNLLSLGI